MSAPTLGELSALLLRLRLLDVVPSAPDSASLLRQLVEEKRLTPYQANRLVQGRANDLILGANYIVLDRLGKGGFGEVFRVRHRALGRVQALKLLAAGLGASTEATRRFEREMQALGAVSHPNIVTVFDAGQIDGRGFIAMELVEGGDLHSLVRQQGRLDVATASGCVRQAALGLGHAHERGLVHRDVKPANLLCVAKSVPLIVKVADLGLAAWLQDESSDRTPSAIGLGTPDYIAPEQAMDARRADARADLYSLGCTFYYLLTAKVPFPDGTAMQKMLAHMNQTPTPVESHRRDLPVPLCELIRRMMAREPADRPSSASEVAFALRVFCDHPDPAPPTVGPMQASHDTPHSSPSTSLPTTEYALPATEPPGSRQSMLRPPAPPTQRPAPMLTHAPEPQPATKIQTLIRTYRMAMLATVAVLALGVVLWLTLSGGKKPAKVIADLPGDNDLPGLPPGVRLLGNSRWRQWGGIDHLAVHPTQPLLATVGTNTGVSVWEDGRLIRRLGVRKQVGGQLAFSPDGKYLAIGGPYNDIFVWSVEDWTEVTKIEDAQDKSTGGVRGVAFSPSGLLASFGDDKTVRLWMNGKDAGVFREYQRAVMRVAFSPDGNWLASCDEGGVVYLRPMPMGEGKSLPAVVRLDERGKPTQKPNYAVSLAFAADSQSFAVGFADGQVGVYDVALKNTLRRVHKGAVRDLAFSPDGKSLLTASQDATVCLWDVETAQQRGSPKTRHFQAWYAAAFDPRDPGQVFAAGDNGVIYRWRPGREEEPVLGPGHEGPVLTLTVSREHGLLFSAGWDEVVRRWTWPEGKAGEGMLGHRQMITALAVRPDGKELISAGKAGVGDQVHLWELPSCRHIRSFKTHLEVKSLVYGWEGLLLVGGGGGELALFDPMTGKKTDELKGHPDMPVSLAYHARSDLMVTGESGWEGNRSLRLWLPAREKKPIVISGHKVAVSAVAISPDGQVVASGDAGGVLRLWSPAGKRLQEHDGGNGLFRSLAFSDDGRWLASCDDIGNVELRDPASGRVQHTWPLPGEVCVVRFTPDGRYLLTGNYNGTIGVIEVP